MRLVVTGEWDDKITAVGETKYTTTSSYQIKNKTEKRGHNNNLNGNFDWKENIFRTTTKSNHDQWKDSTDSQDEKNITVHVNKPLKVNSFCEKNITVHVNNPLKVNNFDEKNGTVHVNNPLKVNNFDEKSITIQVNNPLQVKFFDKLPEGKDGNEVLKKEPDNDYRYPTPPDNPYYKLSVSPNSNKPENNSNANYGHDDVSKLDLDLFLKMSCTSSRMKTSNHCYIKRLLNMKPRKTSDFK